MYVTKDGKYYFPNPVKKVGVGEKTTLHPYIFKCDDMIAPIVAIFNFKGYITDNSRNGSIGNSISCTSFVGDINDDVNIVVCQSLNEPYISFEETSKLSPLYDVELPKDWYLEFYRDNYYKIFDGTIEDKLSATGYRYSIRLDMTKYESVKDNYDFYKMLIDDIQRLHYFVIDLPYFDSGKRKKIKVFKEIEAFNDESMGSCTD